MSNGDNPQEHIISKGLAKVRERADVFKKTHPYIYYPIWAVVIILGITLHHFYEKILDKITWGVLVKIAFYSFWVVITILLFALDRNRSKKNATPMSWEPWMLFLGLFVMFVLDNQHVPDPLPKSSLIVTNTVYVSSTNFITTPQWYLKMKYIQLATPLPPDSGGLYCFRLLLTVNGKTSGSLPFETASFCGITNAVDDQDVVALEQADHYSINFLLQKIEVPGSEYDLRFTNVLNNVSGRTVGFKANELPASGTNYLRLIYPRADRVRVIYEITTNQ